VIQEKRGEGRSTRRRGKEGIFTEEMRGEEGT